MTQRWAFLIGSLVFSSGLAAAQNGSITLPRTIQAGSAFSVQSAGSGKAVLYIVGLGQVIKRDMQLGETTEFPSGTIFNAGHYITVLVRQSAPAEDGSFEVVPSTK